MIALNEFEDENISPIETLGNVIASVGSLIDQVNGYVIREAKHPAASIITEENINEKILVDTIAEIFRQGHEKLWFRSRINLWDFVPKSREPLKILKQYNNPLQPDIDLLYCHNLDNKLQSPLVGAEIKLFSKRTGYGKVIPKTSSWAGYYAGLDEAIALLNFGIDYVYLWHLFVFPAKRLFKLYTKYGEDFSAKVAGANIDYINYCSLILKWTILAIELPIGYIPTFLFIDNEEEAFWFIQPINVLGPEFNVLAQIPSNPARKLVLGGLGIEDIRMRFLPKKCPSCNYIFNPRNVGFKYCPLCGTELTEK